MLDPDQQRLTAQRTCNAVHSLGRIAMTDRICDPVSVSMGTRIHCMTMSLTETQAAGAMDGMRNC